MALPEHRKQRNWGPRVHDIVWHGIPTVVMENELLRVSILAGKGTDVVELLYKPRDLDFAWLTPGGIRNPLAYLPSSPDAMPFSEFYPGGWQEIFPHGGVPGASNGTTFGQHAEVYALPWDAEIVRDDEAGVSIRFTVFGHRTPVRLAKTIHLDAGSPGIRLEETLTNLSGQPVQAMWGHHITFGSPFMRPGMRLTVPDGLKLLAHPMADGVARRIDAGADLAWPVTPAADGSPLDLSVIPDRGTTSEMLYLTGFADETAWYHVEHPETGMGATVRWDATEMPYLWYWQEFGATTRYPWYGDAYVIGLEPFTSMPANAFPDAAENPTAFTLAPHEERSFWLTWEVTDGAKGGAA